MYELDGIGVFADGPLAGVHDVVGSELAIGGFIGLLEDAYADLDERIAGLGFVVAERMEVGLKFFDGPHDGVVEFGVVAREPLAEVFVALPLEAGDYAGPIEASAAIVAVDGVGQIELGADGGSGDLDARRIDCRHQ